MGEDSLEARISRGLSGQSTSRPPSSKTTDLEPPPMPESLPIASPDISTLRTELRTMLENIQSSIDRREAASVERHTKLSGIVEVLARRVESVAEDHLKLSHIVTTLEQAFPGVRQEARKAMESHAKLEEMTQLQWRSVMEALDHQNDLAAKAEIAKKEARERESIAAKRLAEREKSEADARFFALQAAAAEREQIRTHNETRLKIVVAAGQAVAIAAFTTLAGYYGIQAMHQDTNAKIDTLTRQVERASPAVSPLPRNLSSVVSAPAATSAASPPPSAASPPPAAESR